MISRFGKLLAEGEPGQLLVEYEKDNLEDVFLSLCMQDGDLETAETREDRKQRPAIIKDQENPLLPASDKVQIVQNGSAKHNNNHDKKK